MYKGMNISISEAKKLYEIITAFNNLNKYYDMEIYKLKNLDITKLNLYNAFSFYDIDKIKIQ